MYARCLEVGVQERVGVVTGVILIFIKSYIMGVRIFCYIYSEGYVGQ